MPPMSSTAFTRLTNPWLSNSASASTSLLSRDWTRPDV